VETIKVSEVKDLLESVLPVRDQVVPCLLGQPGIGKTQQIEEFAREHGARVVQVIASQILPNEVSGITMPVEKSKSMEVYDHARLSSLRDGDVLFFDELLEASPQVLSACLTLIQERRMMSGKKLPDVMIVAAANPSGPPSKLKQSVRQRFMFVEVSSNFEDWSKYMRKRHGIDLPSTMTREMDWGDSSKWDNMYNVPTPRTMTKACLYARANAERLTTGSLEMRFLTDMVGIAAASTLSKMFYDESVERSAFDAMCRVIASETTSPQLLESVEEMSAGKISLDELAELYKQVEELDPKLLSELAAALKNIRMEA